MNNGEPEISEAFSNTDHNSTPHANPAIRRAVRRPMKSSMQASIIHAIAMAVTRKPAFLTLRHARRLSKRQRPPARRVRMRSAATPVTKSVPTNTIAQIIVPPIGAKNEAAADIAPLKYLNNASICTTPF